MDLGATDMPQSGVFVDTWGWLALGCKADPSHGEVADLFREMRRESRPLYTSDYILDELITLLFRRERADTAEGFLAGLWNASDLGHLTIERITSRRFSTALELRRRYADKPDISFTDLTTMALMQELGCQQVVTADSHFSKVNMGFELLPSRR